MLVNEIKPRPCLSEYIKTFRIIDFHFPDLAILPFKSYPPRPELCLQFMPKDPEIIVYPESGKTVIGKKTILMGPHTHVIHRHVAREILGLQVIFQPGAFFMLTNISCNKIVNVYMDAEDIFGKELQLVNEQLFHAKDYTGMVLIIETFLIGKFKEIYNSNHRVDEVSRMMSLETNKFSIDKFLKAACLSHRQFDRTFKERVGLTPKYFLQMARFDKAFRMKNRFPQKDWLSIALHCGYYDYQHLVRDYKEFTGYTPPAFFAIDNNAPERSAGDAEI